MSAFKSGHVLNAGNGDQPHLIEVFMDFTCPFSAKMWLPLVTNDDNVAKAFPNVRIVMHQLPQPWHRMKIYNIFMKFV
jgi:protein-disulfide isomerase